MKKKMLCIIMLLLCGCGSVPTVQEATSPNITISAQKEIVQPSSEPTLTGSPVRTDEEPSVTDTPILLTNTPSPMPTETPMPTFTPTPTPVPDTEPPVFEGLCNKEIYVGETVSYKKGVTVTDNMDSNISMEIDASDVNLDVPGVYSVIYSATDFSGNTTKETIIITVKVMDQKEAEVHRLAEQLIDELITEDMSKWDVCYTLWNWCRTKIKYAYSAGDRSTIYAGAYEGLHDRSGDCYAYYATFTILLQKCGIETIEVRRVGGESNHWWNLVNLGDGWYHCDSSPRKVGHTYRCFMQTDEQIQEYTEFYKEKPNYYTFDENLYPERETTIVYDGNID